MHQYTEDEYAEQLKALLPRGRAWNFSPGGVLMGLLRGLSGVVTRLTARAIRIATNEQFPGESEELFEDWETELGLPDACRPDRSTKEQRRYDIIAKLNELGGQSIQYFIGIGKSLGLELTIEEFSPFRVGQNTCGQPIQDDRWNFVWRVLWLSTRITVFRVGLDTCGTPLRSWIMNQSLECFLNRLKPAHTHVIVAYRDIDSPEPDSHLLIRKRSVHVSR